MYGNTMAVGGPAAQKVQSPQMAVQLLRAGTANLTPDQRRRLNEAKAMMATQQYQNELARAVLPRSPKGAEVVSVMVGLGLPVTNPQVRSAYADLFQAAATTGSPNHHAFGAPTMVGMQTVGGFGGGCSGGSCGIPGTAGATVPFASSNAINAMTTVGSRVYGQPTMTGVQMAVGARLVYGQPTMNGIRSF